MARIFRRKHTAQPIAELNVTNMIDLGFTLLIIFMIATPLFQQEQSIRVNLPSESKSAQQKPEKAPNMHSVWIEANGRYHLDNDAAVLTLPQLKTKLRSFGGGREKIVIHIRGDDAVPYGKVVQVIDELKKLDLLSIAFDTQPKP
jgi:biopolymer transport protein TolR